MADGEFGPATIPVLDSDPETRALCEDLFGSASEAVVGGVAVRGRYFDSPKELLSWYFQESAEGRSCPACVVDVRRADPCCMETVLHLRAIDPLMEIVLCAAPTDPAIETIRSRLHEGFHLAGKPLNRGEFLLLVETLVAGWRRKANLAEREERFRSVVRSLGDGVLLLDRNGRILESNSQGRHLLGVRGAGGGDEVLEVVFVDRDGTRLGGARDVFARTFDSGEATRNLVLSPLVDDRHGARWVMANAEAVWREGDVRPHAVVVSIHDITALQRTIDELRRSNEALAAARREVERGAEALRATEALRMRFLANMSHEVRSPMGAILGLSDLLLQGPLDPEMKRIASLLRGSGEALLGVLADIFDYSRIEAGTLALRPVEFDLRSLLEDVAALHAVQAASKGLDLELLVDGDGRAFVVGDPGRIRQILSNILANAIKFTDSGRIRIDAELLPVGEGGTEVRVAVSDTGPGFDPGRISSAFEPFRQTDEGFRRHGGTGVGLAIVRELLDLMGGTIDVESEPGRGSVFRLRFVLDRVVAAPASLPPAEDESLEGMRILVADVREIGRESLAKLVSRFGCHTESVASLETLRSALRTGGTWDAVLVDRSFVRDDPAGWLAALRTQIGTMPPCLLLTPLGVRGEAADAARAGWSAYLTRPLRSRILRTALVRCCRSGADSEILTRHSLEEAFRRGMRILASEPSADGREYLRRAVEGLGQCCTVVPSGAEALHLLERSDFDLVMLDLQPDGLESVRRLRAGEAGNRCRDVLLVATTAGTSPIEAASLLDAGFDEVLPRPWSMRDLGILLRKIQDSVDLGSEFDII